MSYNCGIGPRLARAVKIDRDPRPHITCDGGCGAKIVVEFPPRWFLAGKAPPGWKIAFSEDGIKRHYCKACKRKLTMKTELFELFKERYRRKFDADDDQACYEMLDMLDMERLYDGDGNDMTMNVLDWVDRLLGALDGRKS